MNLLSVIVTFYKLLDYLNFRVNASVFMKLSKKYLIITYTDDLIVNETHITF